jgi:tyrosine-protein kinase Etk/Wzc
MSSSPLSNLLKLQTGTRIKDYFLIIMRRRWIIAIAFFSVFLSTAYYASNIQDIYEAYSTLVVEEQNALIDQAMNYGGRYTLSFYQGILASRTFLEMVFDSIGMETFTASYPKTDREGALNCIRNTIELRKTEYSSFLRFNVRAKSRELAYKIAAIGTEKFREQCQRVATEESRRTVDEIDNQLQLIRGKLEQAEQDYQTYMDKTGDIAGGSTPELRTLQKTYSENMAQLGVKQADLAAEKKLLSSLETQITPSEKERSPEYLRLRTKLQELEKEKVRLEGLGIRLTSISTLDREIQDVENQLLQYRKPQSGPGTLNTRIIQQWQQLRVSVINKESDLELFKRRLESYKSAIDSYKKGNPDILIKSLELQRIERTKQIYENIYNFLLNKAEEERIRKASSLAGIKIVDLARMPSKPIPKNESRYYLLGVIFGLLLGLGLAFLLEMNDTSIKSNEDVERYLQESVLGTIPHITYSKKEEIEIRRKSSSRKRGVSIVQYPRQLLSFAGDDSIITEAYRSLRTNLTFASPDRPLQTVILTSAGPSEGKSLTIANLAMAYAQMGKKTLLVDTDLRRPILHHLFNLKREPGFTDLFGEEFDYAKSIRPTLRENLSIITAGFFTPNPAELIGSHKMEQHLAHFKQHYDIVFFDTPPVVAVTDATLLSTRVDGILLVVKSHHTDREIALRALHILENVGGKIMGIVLNDIDLTHRYSSYGYYKYYYHYYKSKSD